jgi:hypothetical protein
MKTTHGAMALLVLLGACADKKTDNPRVELTDIGFSLHLPASMQGALDAFAPGFRPIRASSFRSDVSQAAASSGPGGMPAVFTALGDFDRDGTIDAVVEGTTPGDSALRVIVIMNGAKPAALEVTRYLVYDADAVGVYLSLPPAATPGVFQVVAYPDSTVVYTYANGGFQGRNVGNP